MGMLELRNITKRFGGLVAVKEFDLTVEEGELVGLIGPNGAGKTTLFNMCACFYPPSSGEIEFHGRAIVGFKPYHAARLGIARTFQVTRPFLNDDVLKNVMVGAFCHAGDVREARRIAWEALETVEFSDRAHIIASELTVAERKRLELARALATQPQLVLVDEVMAGLNPREKHRVLDILRQIRDAGHTLIVVEHDARAIMSLCERIVVIHRGEKLVEGPPEQVAHDPQAIAAYLGEDYVAT
jgi:branched-chain amino acid transport system ATP-binding protein